MQPGNQNSNKYPWGNNEVPVNTEQPPLGQVLPPPDYSVYATPPKKSFFKKNKKFSLIVGGCLGFLLIMTIVAVVASNGTPSSQDNLATNVPLTSHSNDVFSIDYASSMKIEFDERALEAEDWNLVFTEDPEISDYEVKINVSKDQPLYTTSEEQIASLLDIETEARELATSDVNLIGQTTQKSIAKFTGDDEREYYAVFVQAQSGDKWVQVSATYPVDNTSIHDSFDAMVSSIKLK